MQDYFLSFRCSVWDGNNRVWAHRRAQSGQQGHIFINVFSLCWQKDPLTPIEMVRSLLWEKRAQRNVNPLFFNFFAPTMQVPWDGNWIEPLAFAIDCGKVVVLNLRIRVCYRRATVP